MATPTFVVNGSTICYGVTATWEKVVKRRNADGTMVFQPFARHVWDIAQMEESTYLALQALQGQRLASLATTDADDRNEAATYTEVEMGIVTGQHVGRRVTNIRVEFRVQ